MENLAISGFSTCTAASTGAYFHAATYGGELARDIIMPSHTPLPFKVVEDSNECYADGIYTAPKDGVMLFTYCVSLKPYGTVGNTFVGLYNYNDPASDPTMSQWLHRVTCVPSTWTFVNGSVLLPVKKGNKYTILTTSVTWPSVIVASNNGVSFSGIYLQEKNEIV